MRTKLPEDLVPGDRIADAHDRRPWTVVRTEEVAVPYAGVLVPAVRITLRGASVIASDWDALADPRTPVELV